MKMGKRVLIVYIILQFLTVGCSSTPISHEEWLRRKAVNDSMQETADNLRKNAMVFHCIGRESMPECMYR